MICGRGSCPPDRHSRARTTASNESCCAAWCSRTSSSTRIPKHCVSSRKCRKPRRIGERPRPSALFTSRNRPSLFAVSPVELVNFGSAPTAAAPSRARRGARREAVGVGQPGQVLGIHTGCCQSEQSEFCCESHPVQCTIPDGSHARVVWEPRPRGVGATPAWCEGRRHAARFAAGAAVVTCVTAATAASVAPISCVTAATADAAVTAHAEHRQHPRRVPTPVLSIG